MAVKTIFLIQRHSIKQYSNKFMFKTYSKPSKVIRQNLKITQYFFCRNNDLKGRDLKQLAATFCSTKLDILDKPASFSLLARRADCHSVISNHMVNIVFRTTRSSNPAVSINERRPAFVHLDLFQVVTKLLLIGLRVGTCL